MAAAHEETDCLSQLGFCSLRLQRDPLSWNHGGGVGGLLVDAANFLPHIIILARKGAAHIKIRAARGRRGMAHNRAKWGHTRDNPSKSHYSIQPYTVAEDGQISFDAVQLIISGDVRLSRPDKRRRETRRCRLPDETALLAVAIKWTPPSSTAAILISKRDRRLELAGAGSLSVLARPTGYGRGRRHSRDKTMRKRLQVVRLWLFCVSIMGLGVGWPGPLPPAARGKTYPHR